MKEAVTNLPDKLNELVSKIDSFVLMLRWLIAWFDVCIACFLRCSSAALLGMASGWHGMAWHGIGSDSGRIRLNCFVPQVAEGGSNFSSGQRQVSLPEEGRVHIHSLPKGWRWHIH